MAPLTRLSAAAAITVVVVAGTTAVAEPAPTLDATWPATSSVKAGRALMVTGTATGVEAGAEVSLQYDLPTGWRTAVTTAVADDGSWEAAIPTGWLHRRLAHRVVLDDTGAATDTWSLRVRPGWKPRGRRAAWTSLVDRGVLRWNPCAPVRWRLNLRGAPKGARATTREAVRRTAQATGLRFDYRGRTRHVPRMKKPAPAGTDLVVAWARPSQTDLMSGSASGAAGVQIAHSTRRIDGEPEWLVASAGIAMNRSQRPPRLGFRGGNSLGAILMHELGHAVGLNHVGQRSGQLMAPVATPGHQPLWGAGDLAGLEYVGLAQGCGGADGAARVAPRRAAGATYVVVD